MNTNSNNSMETVLKEILRLRGLSVFSDGRVLASMYCDLSGEKKDQRLLRYFVECGGHTALLDAKNLSPSMQKARFTQTVNKMCAETLVSEEAARQVCNAFWSAVYGSPMEETPMHTQEVKQKAIQPEQKEQPIPKFQQETAKQPPMKPEAPAKKYSYFDKPEFYISREEAEKGGEIPVYYKSDMLYITIPPHTPDKYQARPVASVRVLDADKCRFNERGRGFNEIRGSYYSDALVHAYVNHGWKEQFLGLLWIIFLFVAAMYAVTVVFGGVACLLSFWEKLPSIMLDFSSIKNALRSIFSIAYWTWPLFVAVIGDFFCGVRESLDLKKELQNEIERRKKLPLRK